LFAFFLFKLFLFKLIFAVLQGRLCSVSRNKFILLKSENIQINNCSSNIIFTEIIDIAILSRNPFLWKSYTGF